MIDLTARLRDLAADHLKNVADHPGEVYTTIPTRKGGQIVGHIPCYLPAWMRSDEREEFLVSVNSLLDLCANDPEALAAIHAVRGVPMPIPPQN